MSSQTDDSISGWLSQLHAGDAAAIQLLWDKFYKRLVAVADRFLTGLPPIQDDGEDVAASVFQSFWRGGQGGAVPEHQRPRRGVVVSVPHGVAEVRGPRPAG